MKIVFLLVALDYFLFMPILDWVTLFIAFAVLRGENNLH
jgi:hypothetical protein